MKTIVKWVLMVMVAACFAAPSVSFAQSEAKDGEVKVIKSKARQGQPGAQAVGSAKDVEAEEARTCGITGECHVDSRVNAFIRVYINGRYRGTIAPFGDIYPFVGDFPEQITTLYAVTDDGRFWRRTVSGNVGNYHWTLYP